MLLAVPGEPNRNILSPATAHNNANLYCDKVAPPLKICHMSLYFMNKLKKSEFFCNYLTFFTTFVAISRILCWMIEKRSLRMESNEAGSIGKSQGPI